MLLFFVILSAIVLAISIASTIQKSELWVEATCWILFILSLVGIAELRSSYIRLGEVNLRIRKNFRTTVVPRESIESVAVAKGCPTTLLLKNGGRVTVPDLGGRGVDNSIRAWIRAT